MKSTSINLMLQNNFHSKRQCSNCIKRENRVLSLVRSLTKGKASCWMDANVDNVQVCGYQKKKSTVLKVQVHQKIKFSKINIAVFWDRALKQISFWIQFLSTEERADTHPLLSTTEHHDPLATIVSKITFFIQHSYTLLSLYQVPQLTTSLYDRTVA